MAIAPSPQAKTAHVNMMTDTIIANLPAEALRSIVRAILTTHPTATSVLEDQARKYLKNTANEQFGELFIWTTQGIETTTNFTLMQQRIRSTIGCGLVLEALPLLTCVLEKFAGAETYGLGLEEDDLERSLAALDGDIVQALTAVQKRLFSAQGSRNLDTDEEALLVKLLRVLSQVQQNAVAVDRIRYFERSIPVLQKMLGEPLMESKSSLPIAQSGHYIVEIQPSTTVETFSLKAFELPRLFSGLWQLSSPSWGSASQSQMMTQFMEYISNGFTAFDMADHYGDAEVIFGQMRSSLSDTETVFGATKYCIFHQTTINAEVVRANITERCQRMSAEHIDLLQFHWQDYDDHQYIDALRFLQRDERVRQLGLCNFDTERLQEIVGEGIDIVTNQVQFSLIDARPRFKMGEICARHNVKLLTYGTLCGGFLADKWLGKHEPQLFGAESTPSQRKYFEMIQTWGDWDLFQTLLQVLRNVADKHDVSISNVATRWVLDFPYVGAVIVGARMGVSEHMEDNLKTYGWHLDSEDQRNIEAVLEKSRREEIFKTMGDCGSEYR
jgi:aryl-alcohol dehydrogenase-like predicted oxidoreductase